MIAFIPEFALHSATTRPMTNPKPSFVPLPNVRWPICSRRRSTAPCGKIPVARERSSPTAAGLAKSSIKRNKGSKTREDGEQTVEHNAGSDREQTILAHLLVCAPEDVLPTSRRNLPRRLRMPAAAGLAGARVLHSRGLVAAAGGAKSARCGPTDKSPFYIVKARNLARDRKSDHDSPADERPERRRGKGALRLASTKRRSRHGRLTVGGVSCLIASQCRVPRAPSYRAGSRSWSAAIRRRL